MLRKIHLYASLIALSMSLLNCSKQSKTNEINLQLINENKNDSLVYITRLSPITYEEDTIAWGQYNLQGQVYINHTFDAPQFINLKTGTRYFQLYLEPGYNLKIHIPSHSDSITFSGKGSALNNFLSEQNLALAHFNSSFFKDFGNAPKFIATDDSVSIDFENRLNRFADSLSLTDKTLLKNKNQIRSLAQRTNFVMAMYGGSPNESELPTAFRNLNDQIPYDSTMLQSGLIEYAILLQSYLQIEFLNKPFSDKTPAQFDSINKNLNDNVSIQINQQKYPDFITEYFQAVNINMAMALYGLNNGAEKLLSTFRDNYPRSLYTNSLQKKYDKWIVLSQGKPAPDFRGKDLKGNSFSLHDLKGKIVYVDVWATWCGPCKQEIPISKKIQQSFSKDSRVEFLYVSVDKNEDAWKKMVSEDKDFKGTHMVQDGSIYKDYLISGIPRYILIDDKGNIVDSMAPRPSSGRVESMINELLRQM